MFTAEDFKTIANSKPLFEMHVRCQIHVSRMHDESLFVQVSRTQYFEIDIV